MGLISAVLSVIYFVSAGTVTLLCSSNITYTVRPPRDIERGAPADVKIMVFMLSGTVIQTVCWCIVLILSVCYKYRDPENLPLWNAAVRFDCRASADRRRWPFTPGFGRILCIPCVILSAVGWCVYIGGYFNLTLFTLNMIWYSNPTFILAPLSFLAALLHAGSASTVMGAFTAVLNMLFLSFMGSDISWMARSLHYGTCESDISLYNIDVCYYDKLVLGGGIVCLFFWGCVLALWPFYRNYPPPVYSTERSTWNTPTYGIPQRHPSHYSDTQPLLDPSTG